MQRIWERARSLRNDATRAERCLWHYLRRRQMVGVRFRRQLPLAGYIVDFACVSERLVIELDGGQHLEQAAYDRGRTAKLERQGYRVMRFWNDDVLLRTDQVLEQIWREVSRGVGRGD